MDKVNLMDYSENWKNLYKEITENNGYYEMGSVNWYNLASILEDLYVENAELKARVEALERDTQPWTHPESGLASNIGSSLLDAFHDRAINSKKEKKND